MTWAGLTVVFLWDFGSPSGVWDTTFNDYIDITERIAEPPKWWDEHGVPRYAEFSPYLVANIYAEEVVLVEIACQACRSLFPVAFSSQGGAGPREDGRSLADNIRSGEIHYAIRPTMVTVDLGLR